MQLSRFEIKLPNLILKTRPKQFLGSLPLDIALPAFSSQTETETASFYRLRVIRPKAFWPTDTWSTLFMNKLVS
jgi:hypothetical protein